VGGISEDEGKGRKELLDELSIMRQRVFEMDRSETLHRQAEERARESEQRFRALVETTSDWVWEVDRDARYTYASPKVRDLLGYEPEDVIGKTPFDFMPADEAERVAELFGEILQFRRPFSSLENVNLHRDGSRVVLETSGVPVFDSRGDLVGYRGIDRDITGRKRAEETLRESESRFRELADSLPQIVAEMDQEGNFTFVNQNAFVVTGYTRQDMEEGLNVLQMVAPEDHARLLENMGKVMRGNTFSSNEYTVVRKDGSRFPAAVYSNPIFSQKNEVGCRAILMDITDLKRQEQALRESETMLQNTMEQLRHLSHRLLEIQEKERRYLAVELHDEMGQILTALRISLKRAERSMGRESRMIDINESVQMVDGLIERVRNLSIELRPSILDDFGLTAALEWYVNWLSAKTGFKIAFHTEVPEARFSAVLELTSFRITQEALTNAVRHSDANIVQVLLAARDGELHLTVKDDGKGFTTDRAHRKESKGRSFGLLGMQERASLAGGRLDIESQPGRGTTVHACFPLPLTREG
jgi:PAS domain S-box-containing protein